MSQYTLTVIDTSGIQPYIFGSNKLKHSIGASQLVYEATHDWVYQKLHELGPTNIDQKGEFNSRRIVEDGLTSELVYVGGGNAVILFNAPTTAQTFAQNLTRHALMHASGLELVVTHLDFNWQNDVLKDKVSEAFEKLGQKKRDRARSMPLLGLGVTANCQYTGLPAVSREPDEDRRISAEIEAKIDPNTQARAYHRLDKAWTSRFKPPHRADFLGREVHESSYLAVVHIDGNRVGKRIKVLADQYSTAAQNRDYIRAVRDFSVSLAEKSIASLQHMIQLLDKSVIEEKERQFVIGPIKLHQDDQGAYLPFRPLIFGGDDLTFICDGRLGLSLAAAYIQHFNRHLFPAAGGQEKPITTRAGVAVVKTHYPFARAYELAEELARSAKKYFDERYISDDQREQICPLDWHFAVGGTVLDLKTIREREYLTKSGNLTMRPIRVIGNTRDWRSWDNLRKIMVEFQGEKWQDRRNKIKALREALRYGPTEVKAFLRNFNQGDPLPDIAPHIPALAQEGWADGRCGYFDAIEAIDLFTPLDDVKEAVK